MLLILAAATLACAVAGFTVTQYQDVRLAAARHAAVQLALDELPPITGEPRFGAADLNSLARRAGLKDLRFDADPSGRPEREEQSLHNANGRIVGWFSWAPDRGFIRALDLLWGFAALVASALTVCALLIARSTYRLAASLARSTKVNRKLTSEDALTGLPNRRTMLEHLEQVLARRGDMIVALVLVDLDGFREVNYALGRAGGDTVLATIAERLKTALPVGARFGRFEDDEFAIVLESVEAPAVAALADKVRDALSKPVVVDQIWQISGGIGIAAAPDDGFTGEELCRRAGLALRAAKLGGRSMVQRFEPRIETENSERRFILRELETAIYLGALDLHYQPVVAAAGGGILGVEALLRWTHPTRGPIPPSEFIPLAEQNGLMLQLGSFALRRALADGARWPNLSVAVNLSPVQIRDPHLVGFVGAAMADAGIAPSRVVLEVTEGVLIDDPQEALKRLQDLRALGVRLALDDFGSGYSSLSYLQKFPFNLLKIDRAFVASLGNDGNAGAIVQSIVTLGHALGMRVLAEGVETDEQRVLLRLAGCDEMQGYLFAEPRAAEAIDKILARPAAAARAPAPALSVAQAG
jgi:diguanylate cyclase (GGDEF)-like protein